MLNLSKTLKTYLMFCGMVSAVTVGLSSSAALAIPVTLQNATATFSQDDFFVSEASDGIVNATDGWALHPNETAQVAVWETSADFTGNTLNFSLVQIFQQAQHLLGNFRLSVTSDDRSTFADGLHTGGDVTANWTILTGAMLSTTGGSQTLTELGNNSILAGGTTPNTATYSALYTGIFTAITGIRLEVLVNGLLPSNGPGTQPSNGNFVLTEITLDQSVSTIPVPAALPLFGTGLAIMGFVGWRRKHKINKIT